MAGAFTHFAVAKTTLERLPKNLTKKITSERMFLFGAQGADFCFLYRPLSTNEINFGRFLHNKGSYPFFRILTYFSIEDPDLFSYALGYVSHYATDCVFHPYVYALSKKSPVKHSFTEGALDEYYYSHPFLSENKSEENDNGENKSGNRPFSPDANGYFTPLPNKKEREKLYGLYAFGALYSDREPLIKESFFKSITAHKSYLKISGNLFRSTKEKYLNTENSEWSYPQEKTLKRTDGAKELFFRAVREGTDLIIKFSDCVFSRTYPKKEDFGKSFLSGLDKTR